jgi:hypothetical protein
LSFGDLAAVMFQVKFCQAGWFPGMLTLLEQEGEVNYPAELEGLMSPPGYPEKTAVRCIEKSLIPIVFKILQVAPTGCVFLSKPKSLLLSRLLQDINRRLESSPSVRKALIDACTKSIRVCLDNLAIPICRRCSHVQVTESIIDADFAKRYALSYQASLVGRMLSNIVKCFFHLLPHENSGNEGQESEDNGIAALVFNFINDKFLMILSSMEHDRAKEAFEPVYEMLRKDGQILQSPSLFLASLPLRAAAQAYCLPTI